MDKRRVISRNKSYFHMSTGKNKDIINFRKRIQNLTPNKKLLI